MKYDHKRHFNHVHILVLHFLKVTGYIKSTCWSISTWCLFLTTSLQKEGWNKNVSIYSCPYIFSYHIFILSLSSFSLSLTLSSHFNRDCSIAPTTLMLLLYTLLVVFIFIAPTALITLLYTLLTVYLFIAPTALLVIFIFTLLPISGCHPSLPQPPYMIWTLENWFSESWIISWKRKGRM